MGVMVLDESQLIPISQNGVPDENFVENAGENEIDSLENNGYNENDNSEIIIGRSVGAKAKNYDILLPNGKNTNLTEGTRIHNIQTIAGKGKKRKIDEVYSLIDRFGGSEFEWQKKKGIGYIDYNGESFCVELHWYEEPSVGKCKWKIKPDVDGNWFIDED